jgi:Icc-related predicted phosphoesterase
MKILMIADHEESALWGSWSERTAGMLSDVDLILSAGDLSAKYLEFLVTLVNVPLVYVRGNHDGAYDYEPPEGCIDADGRMLEIWCGRGSNRKMVRILGLGGSMRYKDRAADMYTEKEMRGRISKLRRKVFRDELAGRLSRGRSPDILLTHAPCKGYGDMEDIAHTGFECFNALLGEYHPKLHVYGHVHREYGDFTSAIPHPSGTQLINASGYCITDI